MTLLKESSLALALKDTGVLGLYLSFDILNEVLQTRYVIATTDKDTTKTITSALLSESDVDTNIVLIAQLW